MPSLAAAHSRSNHQLDTDLRIAQHEVAVYPVFSERGTKKRRGGPGTKTPNQLIIAFNDNLRRVKYHHPAGLSRPSKRAAPLDTTIVFHDFFHLRERGAGFAQEVPDGAEEGNRMKEFPLVP